MLDQNQLMPFSWTGVPAALQMRLPQRRRRPLTATGVSPVCCAAKDAVTDRSAVRVTTQEPVPVHAPLQPENVEFAAGVAVRVTVVPDGDCCEQVAPQLMEPPETVPDPVPVVPTVRV